MINAPGRCRNACWLASGFDAATTAAEVIDGFDLSGKVAIVTGGYSGIGLESARVLRAAGARVIVPARDHAKAANALQGIDVEIEMMNLLDPASIDTFASRFLAGGDLLHILVNSAGIMANPLTRDPRRYESQFATNHLDPSKNLKTVQQGAATIVRCATSLQLDGMGGKYCENCENALPVPETRKADRSNDALARPGAMLSGVMPYAIDSDTADRLWALSERLTGRTF